MHKCSVNWLTLSLFKMLFIIPLLLGGRYSWAEKNTTPLSFPAAKSHYILEMIKQVYWPEEKKLTQLNIGVIGGSNKLIEAFNNNYSQIRVRNIPIKISVVNVNKVPEYYQLIYVDDSKLSDIDKINLRYPKALIISDGEVRKSQQFLSFISGFDNIKITFNIDNLHARNFLVSNNLLFFAGNKDDLEKQLKVKDSLLKDMYSEIQDKKNELENINQTLEANNQNLHSLAQKLASSEKELLNKEKQLIQTKDNVEKISLEKEAIEISIKQNQVKLALQQEIILVDQQEEAALKKLILQQQDNIKLNQNELQQQETNIKLQKAKINNQTQVISNQKSLLYLSVAIIVLVIVFSFFLWHVNQLRRKSNKKLRELNEKLYESATTDGMTGLFNRRHFIESAQLQIAHLKRTKYTCAVLMMDIDLFKNVNDTYGHAMGDRAITAIGEVFKENLRTYDLLGRLGGEEYGMFLTNCEISKALVIAERLREQTALMPIVFDGITIYLSVSVGVTEVTFEDEDINRILQRADKALYKAKLLGRNRVELYDENT